MVRPKGMAAAVMMLTVAILCLSGSAEAGPIRLGAGVFGFYGIPVAQDDVDPGPVYGAKLKANLIGMLGAEASYMSFQGGDVNFDVRDQQQTLEGGTQNVWGLNAVLGGPLTPGFGLYFTGGIGSYSLKWDDRADATEFGYNGGLGFEYGIPSGIAIDVSGRFHAILLDGGGSRKLVTIQGGVNYYFLP